MGVYANTFRDFPLRVRDIWTRYREGAEESNREVTLLLMTAAAGLSMPLEFYKEKKDIAPAKMLNEVKELERFQTGINDLLSTPIKSGSLIELEYLSQWKYAVAHDIYELNDIIEAGSFVTIKDTDQHNALISRLRNSISHFGIKTISRSGNGIIDRIVFVSEKRDSKSSELKGYHIYMVHPLALENLLEKWFAKIDQIYYQIYSPDDKVKEFRGYFKKAS